MRSSATLTASSASCATKASGRLLLLSPQREPLPTTAPSPACNRLANKISSPRHDPSAGSDLGHGRSLPGQRPWPCGSHPCHPHRPGAGPLPRLARPSAPAKPPRNAAPAWRFKSITDAGAERPVASLLYEARGEGACAARAIPLGFGGQPATCLGCEGDRIVSRYAQCVKVTGTFHPPQRWLHLARIDSVV